MRRGRLRLSNGLYQLRPSIEVSPETYKRLMKVAHIQGIGIYEQINKCLIVGITRECERGGG